MSLPSKSSVAEELRHYRRLMKGISMPTTLTGRKYPMERKANCRWRAGLLDRAEKDKEFQAGQIALCAADPVYLMAAYGYIYKAHPYPPEDLPFIPYECQVRLARWLMEGIEKSLDGLGEKSRDVGFTWTTLHLIAWYWRFGPPMRIGLSSRTVDCIEKRGDMDALFSKLDYIVDHWPSWLWGGYRGRPDHRRDMIMTNPDTGASIVGQAFGKNMGRSGRWGFGFLDEFGFPENSGDDDEAWSGTERTCGARLPLSSPSTTRSKFNDLAVASDTRKFTLHWSIYPPKALGAYYVTKGGDIEILDEDYVYPKGYEFKHEPRLHVRSPAYDEAEKKMQSSVDMAREWDINYAKAGNPVFDTDKIKEHIELHARPPMHLGNVEYVFDPQAERVRLGGWNEQGGERRWALWFNLDTSGFPDRNHSYVIAADVATGSGNSNSVLSVWDVNERRMVAQYADPHISPEDLARLAVAACAWFAGAARWCYLGWEANGPGDQFGSEVLKLKYSRIYWQKDEVSVAGKPSLKPGWWSGKREKNLLLGEYRKALNRQDVVNPCIESLEEAKNYIYDSEGRPIPTSAMDLTTGAREAHGDRVVADALGVRLLEDQPRAVNRPLKGADPYFDDSPPQLSDEEVYWKP